MQHNLEGLFDFIFISVNTHTFQKMEWCPVNGTFVFFGLLKKKLYHAQITHHVSFLILYTEELIYACVHISSLCHTEVYLTDPV